MPGRNGCGNIRSWGQSQVKNRSGVEIVTNTHSIELTREVIIKRINGLESTFDYERHEVLNFANDAELLRKHYPFLTGWDDVPLQNAWDRYATAVLYASSIDVGFQEEFIGYLVYLTTLSDPDSIHPEDHIDIDYIREAFRDFETAKPALSYRQISGK